MRITLAFSLAAAPALAQDTTLAARIRRVETGLSTAVVVAGQGGQRGSIEERMQAFHTPAVSVAVLRGGRVEWARAYGTLEAGGAARADTSTRFQAASISKPVAVLAALLRVD